MNVVWSHTTVPLKTSASLAHTGYLYTYMQAIAHLRNGAECHAVQEARPKIILKTIKATSTQRMSKPDGRSVRRVACRLREVHTVTQARSRQRMLWKRKQACL
eukprot:6192793-Pleurochrysis_carterae.AAC.2